MLIASGGGSTSGHIENPAGILAVFLVVLAILFRLGQTKGGGKIFSFVPMLIFCYFVPTALATAGIIPHSSPLYSWIKTYALPVALLLLILALDLKALLRLGPKAVIMLLAGTLGVVLGGPLALYCGIQLFGADGLPPDLWQGLTALAGSWIGGGANFVALGDIAGATDPMMALMVVPDVAVANVWMAVLLWGAAFQHTIDRITGANASAIRELETKLADFQERVARIPTLTDFLVILAIGFGVAWVSFAGGKMLADGAEYTVRDMAAKTTSLSEAELQELPTFKVGRAIDEAVAEDASAMKALSVGDRFVYRIARFSSDQLGATTWKFLLLTTIGLFLSFTPLRNYEGAGASKIGSVLIYLLVACIGASANFTEIGKNLNLIVIAAMWMVVHITVLLVTAWLIKAPIFFVAVGSQANIGGAASAPVVAAAYHPALAPVGALMAVAGYVLGTYAGLLCMSMMRAVSGG